MNNAHKLNTVNYANNADLLEYEIYDFDTKDAHETGINTYRMRLPDRYDIAKFYKRSKRPSSYDKLGFPRYEKGKWTKKSPSDMPVFTDMDFDWQITYEFPSTPHNNISPLGKVYGGANVSYRRLYLILCERFNGGDFFVDEYFNSVYPGSWVKDTVDVELNNIKDEMVYYAEDLTEGAKITKRGNLDKRQRGYADYAKALDDWSNFVREWEDRKGNELAEYIKDDIIKSLANGEIPLNHSLASSTRRKRVKAGYDEEPLFYAMGDLIEHIQLYVKIGGNGKWKTEQGLVV